MGVFCKKIVYCCPINCDRDLLLPQVYYDNTNGKIFIHRFYYDGKGPGPIQVSSPHIVKIVEILFYVSHYT